MFIEIYIYIYIYIYLYMHKEKDEWMYVDSYKVIYYFPVNTHLHGNASTKYSFDQGSGFVQFDKVMMF